MDERIRNVLFVCTGNSARSIIAEGLLNHIGKDRFRACSAGSHPKGSVHPMALSTLSGMRIPPTGFRSKNWEEFARPDAPLLDFVFTVCDKAAGEMCPVWPGQPVSAHWGVPDPAEATGDEATIRKAFAEAALVLKRRIELLLALPLEKLDAMSLRNELARIGKQ